MKKLMKMVLGAASVALLGCGSAFGEVLHWRGTVNELASNPANWVNDDGLLAPAPESWDDIVLDANSADKPLTWDINESVGSWTQTADYNGTVTFQTGISRSANGSGKAAYGALAEDGVTRVFKVTGDVTINGGKWTHAANPAMKSTDDAWIDGKGIWRLIADVGGNFTLGTGASINLTGKGFCNKNGPGYVVGNGASHGGLGGESGVCYGRITAPACLGSGGESGKGGGALELSVAGSSTIDGLIVADGEVDGAGGSVWITARKISGNGSIVAAGAESISAGGGRVSVCLTGVDETFDNFATNEVTACGSRTSNAAQSCGGAGTVYLETHEQMENKGTLVIDNATPSGCTSLATDIGANVTDANFGTVVVRNGAKLAVLAGQTLTVNGDWKVSPDDLTLGEGARVVLAGVSVLIALPTDVVGLGFSVSNLSDNAEIELQGTSYALPIGKKVGIYAVPGPGYGAVDNPYIIDEVKGDTTIDTSRLPTVVAVWCVTAKVEGLEGETLTVEGLEKYGITGARVTEGTVYLYLPDGTYWFIGDGVMYRAVVEGAATDANVVSKPNRLVTMNGFTAQSYVQDGLLAQWDGVENMGYGLHDPHAQIWRNLSAQGAAWDLTWNGLESIAWDAKGLTVSGPEGADVDARGVFVGNISSSELKQVETISSQTGDGLYFITWPGVGYQWAGGTDGGMYVARAGLNANGFENIDENIFYNHSWDDANNMLYRDWRSCSTRSTVDAKSLDANTTVIGRFDGDGNPTIRSVRLYTKTLSEAERRINYGIDQVRFDGEDVVTTFGSSTYKDVPAIVVAGEPVCNGESSLPYGITVYEGSSTNVGAVTLAGLRRYEDGAWGYPGAFDPERSRAVFLGYRYRIGTENWVDGTEASFDLGTVEGRVVLAWRFGMAQVRTEILAQEGGSVRFGDNSGLTAKWTPVDTELKVVAEPAAGYIFHHWEVDGRPLEDLQAPEQTFVADGGRTLTAVFVRDSGTLPLASVEYRDAEGKMQTATDVSVVGPHLGQTLKSGWYAVCGTNELDSLTVEGEVNLILMDGAKLTATAVANEAGIAVTAGNSLTIYGQQDGSGVLSATGGNGGAGIGGSSGGAGGSVTINGGTVTATGGCGGAGIGGGWGRAGGEVVIRNGAVKVLAGDNASVIGHGADGYGDGTVSISGGIFGMFVADGWCAERYGVLQNPDPASAADYPWTVVLFVAVTLEGLSEHAAAAAYTFGDGSVTNAVEGTDFKVPWGMENVKVIFTPKHNYQFVDAHETGVRELDSPLVKSYIVTPPEVEGIPGTDAAPWPVGENVTAYVSDEGVLVIGGTGAMSDFASAADVPWSAVAGDVTAVTVEDGVTKIGKNAWADLAEAVTVNGAVLSVIGFAAPGLTSGEPVIPDDKVLVSKESIQAAKAETVTVDGGAVTLGVTVNTNGDLTAETKSWQPVELKGENVTVEDGKIVITIPVDSQSGFMILQSGDAKIAPAN